MSAVAIEPVMTSRLMPYGSQMSARFGSNRLETIPFYSPIHHPDHDALLPWLEQALAVRFVRVDRPMPGLCHAPVSSDVCAVQTPIQLNDEPPPLLEDFDRQDVQRWRGRLPFDFFSAVKYWLSDRPHARLSAETLDAHQRLPFPSSVFADRETWAAPVVNRYVLLLRRMLEAALNRPIRPLYPEGRRGCVVLTHDVDDPLDRGSWMQALQRARMAASARRGAACAGALLRQSALAWRRMRGRAPRVRRHWLFEDIVGSEAALGFPSTFFFAVRSRHERTAHPEYDVDYDGASPRFKKLYRRLREAGHEIALHASYNAHLDGASLEEERDRLERACGDAVLGVRHHYWRLGHPFWPALRAHEAAGMAYDSSLAFNETPGWRMGAGLPFYPHDEGAGRAVRTLQIPNLLMDGAIWYHRPTPDEALRRVQLLLDDLVRHEAVGAINWHVTTSCPADNGYDAWGRCYQEILQMLHSRDDIWVTDCRSLWRHWQDRRPAGPGVLAGDIEEMLPRSAALRAS